MPLLQRPHLACPATQGYDRVACGRGRREGSGIGNPLLERGSPDRIIVLLRQLAERRIDQKLYLTGHQQINGIGTSLVHLEHPLSRNAASPEISGGTFG